MRYWKPFERLYVQVPVKEEKMSEDSLRKSEANLKAILENSLESIWSIDRAYRIQYANEVFVKAFEEAFGAGLSEGVNILEALPGSIRELWKERYDRAFKGEHFVFNDRIDLPDREIYIEVAMNPILIGKEVIGASFYGRDISKQKNYELQLLAAKRNAEQNEERYNALYKRSNDFVYIHDLEGNFLDANQATLSMFGYSEEEIPELNFLSLLEESELPRAMNEIKKLLEKGRQKDKVEFKLRKKNGEPVYVETMSSVIFQNEQAVAIQGIARDITQRKMAVESYKKLNTAINQSKEIVFITDREGIISFLNPEFSRVYGFTEEEVKGKVTPRILKSGLAPPEQATYLWNKLLNKESILGEYKNRCKDGSLIDIEGSADPILNEEGEIIGFLGIHRDITDRKRVEKDLILAKEKAEESERELRDSQRIARIGYYILDFTTGLWTSSDMLDEIFGIDKGYVRDVEGWLALVHPDFQDEMIEYFNTSVIKNHEPFNKQYLTIHKKTQQDTWVHGYGNLEFNETGELKRMFGTIQDITKSKLIESDLKLAKEKAEESDRLKSAFLANMSHEIRTPMNGILGFLSLLNNTDLNTDTRSKYISILNSSGERLLNTINDIIEISKIESGDVDVTYSDISVQKLASFYYDFFLPETELKNLEFKLIQPREQNTIRIQADKNKLDSVLTNLLKNAIKCTERGKIEFGYEVLDKELKFFVKDTGIGINKESIEVIFDRFIQSDISINRAHEGSGIGLSICKAYVELMGGKIQVESEVHKGSHFYFTIPIHPEEAGKPPVKGDFAVSDPNKALPAQPEKLKILLAEDDKVSIIYLKAILENIDCEIIEAENGEQALDLCKKFPDIDLILMDIQMPLMDGYEATRKIREFNKEVHIIAQTAFALGGDREKALQVGCNEYIPKPIDKEQLLHLLEQYVSGKNKSDPDL